MLNTQWARAAFGRVRVARLSGQAVVKLVASFANSGALLANGKYFDWGYNRAGQLGDGYLSIALLPVMIASGASAISATANNVLIK